MKAKPRKKAAKKSGAKAASVAGRYLEMSDKDMQHLVETIFMNSYRGKHQSLYKLVDDIKTLAASVLSQKEGK